jgi:hypothetical protein
MDNFIRKAESVFEVDLREEYSEKVKEKKFEFHFLVLWFFFTFSILYSIDNRGKAIIS